MSDQTFGKVTRAAMAVIVWAVAVTTVATAFYISSNAVHDVLTKIFRIY